MALTFSPNLKAILDTATSKLDWATKLNEALGNTRRLRCWRHASAATADPSIAGVEFLNVGSTGPLTTLGGNITGFGVLSNVTIRLPADLSTGSSAMRLEGNGYWVQGTLGLVGSTKDFNFSASPTATNGFAFNNAGTKAPRLLPSGTGPAAPAFSANTPVIVELVDWRNPAAPVVVGTSQYSLTRRLDDMVFESPEMAAEIGDVAMYTITPIPWETGDQTNKFDLGGLLMIASNYNTEGGTIQLEQMLLSFKPRGRWATYPFMDTWAKANWPVTDDTTYPPTYGPCTNPTTYDSTYPPPFKINLKKADGTIVFTHEIKAFNDKPSGPINGPEWSQAWTDTEPLVPHFNCAMMLPWQNVRTKMSANKGKYHNGVKPYGYAPKWARSGPSANACVPLITAYSQINSLNNWFWLPAWPMRTTDIAKSADVTYLAAYDIKPEDPQISNRTNYYPQVHRATGYKYQPGAIGGHDWRTGNGGSRYDRFGINHVLALWTSDQNYVRPLGNVPIRDLVEDWGMNYFNHSNHWIRDLNTFESLPKQATLNGDITIANGYYGSGPYGALGESRGPQLTIDLLGVAAGNERTTYHNDASGRMPYGGWQRDNLHAYSNAAWYTILLNSPMHAIAAAHDFHTTWAIQLGQSYPTVDPTEGPDISDYAGGYFTVRSQAWRWLAFTLQWQIASQHSISFSRAEVEGRFQIELETMYDKIYKPTFIDNSQHPYFVSVRNLGLPLKQALGDTVCKAPGGSLGLYMAEVMAMMKQFGLWSVMRQKSVKCQRVLEMMITCWDKAVIDYVLDTDMRDCYYPILSLSRNPTPADIPANWAAQKVMIDGYRQVQGPAEPIYWYTDSLLAFKNFTERSNGTCGEHLGTPHLYYQYLTVRKKFFTEFPHARLDAAIAKMQGYYATYDAALAAGNADPWAYLFPQYWEHNDPTSIGPV